MQIFNKIYNFLINWCKEITMNQVYAYLYGDQNTKTLLQIKYSGGRKLTSCTLREKEKKEKQFRYIIVKNDEGLLNFNEFNTSMILLFLQQNRTLCISSSMTSK